ncbi:uncharacterized protein LOC143875721 [Tasmannia lanceolata]|uniref:uncharacterized protein LOC143875721 n=1 Tax=Tasmannia lanceolata TaxID=3420 RepID=UPI00406281B6
MPPYRQYSRINILELKDQIVRKIGHERSEKYFHHLRRFLSHRISKSEFNKLCLSMIGRANVSLHNQFIGSILKNAFLAKSPPTNLTKGEGSPNVTFTNGHHKNFNSLWGDAIPPSPRKGRSPSIRDRKFRDRMSPLGPYGKIQALLYDELNSEPAKNVQSVTNSCDLKSSQEPQSAVGKVSIGSKALSEVVSLEDGEEVEQVADRPCVLSRSPIQAPLGITMGGGVARKRRSPSIHLHGSEIPETCHSSSKLPDARSLKKRLKHKLDLEGLDVSDDYVNLLNKALGAYLKRLIKPCMELAGTKCTEKYTKRVNGKLTPPDQCVQRSDHCFSASLVDFRTAMELRPQLLGVDWPVQLEKICFRASEE